MGVAARFCATPSSPEKRRPTLSPAGPYRIKLSGADGTLIGKPHCADRLRSRLGRIHPVLSESLHWLLPVSRNGSCERPVRGISRTNRLSGGEPRNGVGS